MIELFLTLATIHGVISAPGNPFIRYGLPLEKNTAEGSLPWIIPQTLQLPAESPPTYNIKEEGHSSEPFSIPPDLTINQGSISSPLIIDQVVIPAVDLELPKYEYNQGWLLQPLESNRADNTIRIGFNVQPNVARISPQPPPLLDVRFGPDTSGMGFASYPAEIEPEPYPPASESAPYPPASESAPYPTASESAAYPPALESAPYPPALESAPYPPALESAPYPPALESAPYPPALESAPYPPALESAPYPPALESAPYPPALESAPYPPALESAPYPSALESAPYPPALESAPYPPALESAPYPPALESAPYPPALESAPYPPALESAPYPPALESAPYPPALESAPYPPALESAPYPSAIESRPYPPALESGSDSSSIASWPYSPAPSSSYQYQSQLASDLGEKDSEIVETEFLPYINAPPPFSASLIPTVESFNGGEDTLGSAIQSQFAQSSPSGVPNALVIPTGTKIKVQDLHGQYSHGFANADGTQIQESGHLISTDNGWEYVIAKEGSYSYLSPENIPIYVRYIADDKGYRIISQSFSGR